MYKDIFVFSKTHISIITHLLWTFIFLSFYYLSYQTTKIIISLSTLNLSFYSLSSYILSLNFFLPAKQSPRVQVSTFYLLLPTPLIIGPFCVFSLSFIYKITLKFQCKLFISLPIYSIYVANIFAIINTLWKY